MSYIDTKYFFECETCRHNVTDGCNTYCDHGESYIPSLAKFPQEDVVEVVRCKDCYYKLGDNPITCAHPSAMYLVNEDSFCSYGVRKGGEG